MNSESVLAHLSRDICPIIRTGQIPCSKCSSMPRRITQEFARFCIHSRNTLWKVNVHFNKPMMGQIQNAGSNKTFSPKLYAWTPKPVLHKKTQKENAAVENVMCFEHGVKMIVMIHHTGFYEMFNSYKKRLLRQRPSCRLIQYFQDFVFFRTTIIATDDLHPGSHHIFQDFELLHEKVPVKMIFAPNHTGFVKTLCSFMKRFLWEGGWT